MGVNRMEFPEVVAKWNCAYGSHSLASSGAHRTPIEWLNYSTNSCFKPEDYVQDPQVMRLHIAARDNNTASMKKSLEQGVSVHQPDEVGRSALHWAAVFCKLDTVESIIKRFPVSRLDQGDRNGCTPLHYAVLAGRADVASMLLKAGCHMHSVDNQGRSPLHYAAQNANAGVVSLLLKRGADRTSLDKLKRSPFDVAVEYNNTNKILRSLQLEASSIISAPEKVKPTERRQKQALVKTKAIEADGKLSPTFLPEDQLEGKQTWQTQDTGADEEEFVTDRPVELVKDEMERDAQRMKNKLRKMEGTKKPISEEKMKVQERALKLLLDRAKRNAMEKQRNKWAEEERFRRITQNRTRSTTPKTSPTPQSSVEITSTGVTVGHFQTSRRPSGASSPLCETEELEPDAEGNGRQGTFASCEGVLEDYFRIPRLAEFQISDDTIFYPTESQAPEYASREAATAVRNANFQHDRAEQVWHEQPGNGQESASVSPTYFPASVQQWFANAFSYPPVPPVMCKMWNPNAPAYTPDMYAEQSNHLASSPAPPPNLDQRNFMGSSVPPPAYAQATNSNVPSVVRSADASQRNSRRPPSALFSYSEHQTRSLASPDWKANGPLDAMGSFLPPPRSAEATNFKAPSVVRSAGLSRGNSHRRPSLEHRNFMGSSIPPPSYAEATSFSAPSGVQIEDSGQRNSQKPPSPLFSYSEEQTSSPTFTKPSIVPSADKRQGNTHRRTSLEQRNFLGSSIPPPTYAEATNFSADLSQGNPSRRPSLEHRNLTGSSTPPTYAEATNFNATSVAPSADAGEGDSRRPPSPLFTYSEQTSSLGSPEWTTNRHLDAPTRGTVTEGSYASYNPPAAQLEQIVNYSADTSAPYDGEKETEVRPRNEDQGLLSRSVSSILDLSCCTPTENPESHDGSSQRYKQSGKSSQMVLGSKQTEDEDEDEDLFTRLGYLHSHQPPRGSYGTPPNRHGFECFTRPNARCQPNKVRVGVDHRWSQPQSPPKHPWSTDKPWRPGGISKTLEHSKIYGSLRRESKRNSIHSIRALIRRMQTQPLDDVDIDSDPFAKPEPKGINKSTDSVEPQHQALWSLRDKSRRPIASHSGKSSPIKDQNRRVMKFVPSQRANNLSSQYLPETCSHRKLADPSVSKKQRANALTSQYLPETCPHQNLAHSVSKTQETMDLTGRKDQAQRELTEQYQTITDEILKPSPVEISQQCQLDPFSQRNSPWLSQTNPLYTQSAFQQSQMDLTYGQDTQLETEQLHPCRQSSSQLQAEISPAAASNQEAQAVSYSTSSQLPSKPHADFSPAIESNQEAQAVSYSTSSQLPSKPRAEFSPATESNQEAQAVSYSTSSQLPSKPRAEFSPAIESNQQAQVSSYSTSSQPPKAIISYPQSSCLQLHTMSHPPNSCLQLHTMPPDPYQQFQQPGTIPFQPSPSNALSPQMLSAWLQQNILVDESHSEVCSIHRGDELENRVPKSSYRDIYEQNVYQEDEIEKNHPKHKVGKARSHCSSKRAYSHCSVERFSPERLALMEYYGQSVRPQFLGLGREQAPVHQCLDIESLQRQWL